ncbi:MAG: tetratricopeptide repeat-containing protein [Spirochaetota bacterium]
MIFSPGEQTRDENLWTSHPHFYIRLGETAYNLGQSMFSHDILKEGLGHFPENLRLNQLYGLALIKCGFLEKSRNLLTRLVHKGYRDEETLGILGRVYKDMWVISGGLSGDRSLLNLQAEKTPPPKNPPLRAVQRKKSPLQEKAGQQFQTAPAAQHIPMDQGEDCPAGLTGGTCPTYLFNLSTGMKQVKKSASNSLPQY